MASQIKKGFFFYFGLFVLVLVAFFMVCVVIMMFNPGSSILWMQYFSGNSTTFVQATTDDSTSNGSTEIDFNNISNISVECGYASVTVTYDDSKKSYSDNGIYIVNKAKGFVVSSAATEFSYSVVYDAEGSLLITVTEPTGFLFFSQDVEIVIHSSSNKEDDERVNFGDISFNITTAGGDVSFGGTNNSATDVALMEANSLTCKTESGDITLTSRLNIASLNELSLTTGGGTISSRSPIASYADENTTTTGIKVACNVALATNSGRIDVNEINTREATDGGTVTITNSSGNVVLGNVISNKLEFASCEKGNYALTEFTAAGSDGIVKFSADKVTTPYLTFGIINGEFLFNGEGTLATCKPTILIDEVTGDLQVNSTAGSVKVGSAGGNVEIVASGAMSVDVVVASESETTNVTISNVGASIRLGFETDMSGNTVEVSSSTGNVTIDFVNSAHFVATMKTSDKSAALSEDKIILNIGDPYASKNPLSYNTSNTNVNDGAITIYTDGNVYFNIVELSSFE